MSRRSLIALGIIVLALIAVVLANRGEDDPETAVRKMILDARAAAEQQDLGGVLEHISESFRARDMGKDGIKGYLFMQLRRGTWRKVFIVDMEVKIDGGETGRVTLRAVLASGDAIGSLQEAITANAGAWRLELDVAHEEDGAWRVTGGEWQQIPAAGLVVPGPG